MVTKNYNTDENEPEQSNFQLPSEKEHLLQVVDVNPLIIQSIEDENIQIVKLEVVGGEEEGRTLLNRVNLNQEDKSFYFSRLFLKAIGEFYKGQFSIDTDRWIGRQLYATVKHHISKDGTKTYANIGEYNFDKRIEHVYQSPVNNNPGNIANPEDIQW